MKDRNSLNATLTEVRIGSRSEIRKLCAKVKRLEDTQDNWCTLIQELNKFNSKRMLTKNAELESIVRTTSEDNKSLKHDNDALKGNKEELRMQLKALKSTIQVLSLAIAGIVVLGVIAHFVNDKDEWKEE